MYIDWKQTSIIPQANGFCQILMGNSNLQYPQGIYVVYQFLANFWNFMVTTSLCHRNDNKFIVPDLFKLKIIAIDSK